MVRETSSKVKHNTNKKIIGVTDYLDIPAADLRNIPCKVDTGAYNCSIDCPTLELKDVNGKPTLCFTLLDEKYSQYQGVEISTTEFAQKKVKSSNGVVEYRYQVFLSIRLLGKRYKARFNLSKRHNMRFPILLGRRFLAAKFIVDVSQKNISLENLETK